MYINNYLKLLKITVQQVSQAFEFRREYHELETVNSKIKCYLGYLSNFSIKQQKHKVMQLL